MEEMYHLPTAKRASADADGGNVESGCHSRRNRRWNAFQHNGKATSGLQRQSMVQNLHSTKAKFKIQNFIPNYLAVHPNANAPEMGSWVARSLHEDFISGNLSSASHVQQ